MGAYWEPMGTWLEYQNEKNHFKPNPHSPKLPQKKLKHDFLRYMLNHLIGCMKYLFLKFFFIIFGMG
jgi:hypothetical protein